MNLFLSHLPSLSELFARGIFLAAANMMPIVSSVAASVLPVGAFITIIPFLLAASTLIFSIPTPARPIILNLPGFSRMPAVMLVPLLVINASYSPITFFSSSLLIPNLISTSMSPSLLSISIPSSEMLSVISTLYLFMSLAPFTLFIS